jgi:site-specific DNA recombinase
MTRPHMRCALYTRKSSEEGLDQAFNSLDAQREACEAYVKSQRSEGWRGLETRYDDGGHSGGTIERPALQRLMADAAAGKIDVVVVYKIDRLTRSLADFARIVEVFDRHGVSFVSVTQAFNTTSSMGRLTLNVLLSFAQFEREVTGERIRDKIAASKARGMWMGGVVPLGYDLPTKGTHKLIVNPAEADRVKIIFETYLLTGSVHALCSWLNAQGIQPKQHITRSGHKIGGQSFSRGALFHLLRNCTYRGRIMHGDTSYPGLHDPIISEELFKSVQAKLDAQKRRKTDNTPEIPKSALTGRIFDANGHPMSPTTARGRSGRLYRYYVSAPLQQGRGADLPIADSNGIRPHRKMEKRAAHRAPGSVSALRRVASNAIEARISAVLERLLPEKTGNLLQIPLRIELHPGALHILLSAQWQATIEAHLIDGDVLMQEKAEQIRLICPIGLYQRSGRTEIAATARGGQRIDATLVRALRAAHAMVTRDAKGLPQLQAAPATPYQRRLIKLAFLSPHLQKSVLDGRQPQDLTLARLINAEIPICWTAQEHLFGHRSN